MMIQDLSQGTVPPGNTSGNHTCEIQDSSLSIVLPASYAVIFIMGLLSNMVAVGVFFFLKHSDTSTTVYMKHLALADMLLVLCLPMRIYYHGKQGPFLLCRLMGISFYVSMYASIIFLSLISLDRYLKIIKPVQVFRVHRVEWSRRAVYTAWVIFACSTPFILLSDKGTEPCDKICFHFHRKKLLSGVINLVVVGLFYVSFLLFVCFYGTIASKLRAMTLGSNDPQAKSRKKRVMMKSFVVPVVFSLCFLPYHVVRVPYILSQMDIIPDTSSKQKLHIVNELMLCLSALNSCLDPVIYFFLSCSFRKTIICALQGKLKKLYSMNERGISVNKSANEV